MKRLQEYEQKIEYARIQLGELVVAKGFDLQDPELISLSDEMDRLIVDFEKAKQVILQA